MVITEMQFSLLTDQTPGLMWRITVQLFHDQSDQGQYWVVCCYTGKDGRLKISPSAKSKP